MSLKNLLELVAVFCASVIISVCRKKFDPGSVAPGNIFFTSSVSIPGKLKNMPSRGGNQTCGVLAQ